MGPSQGLPAGARPCQPVGDLTSMVEREYTCVTLIHWIVAICYSDRGH